MADRLAEGGPLDPEWFRRLVESMPGALYLVTMEGADSRTLYISPRAAELFGLPVDELVPWRIRELLHPDDRSRIIASLELLNEVLEPVTLEYRIIRPDGGVVWIEDTTVIVPSTEGRPALSQGHLIDITDRKQLEAQLLQSQKVEAVGQLAGGIAHEFNNILTAIQGYASFALQRAHDDALRAELIEIQRASERAANLTRQILAFGRQQFFHSRVVDLNDVVDDTKQLVLRLIGENIRVETQLEVPLGAVLADPAQIGQLLVNVALNARDAMPDGGRLSIETLNADLDELAAEGIGVAPGHYVVLRVTDTGVGMSEETRLRAFEPFFTTKRFGEGSGLGLSTVEGIADQSGGRVVIDSTPGRGTVVRVFLPTVEEPVRKDDLEPAPPPTDARTILLVEDEGQLRRLGARMLEQQGYTVLTARDSYEALRVADGAHTLDLLVTDVVLPGMNGVELARKLTSTRPGLRVVYVSGYPAGALAEHNLSESARFLEKPFSSLDLGATVRAALS